MALEVVASYPFHQVVLGILLEEAVNMIIHLLGVASVDSILLVVILEGMGAYTTGAIGMEVADRNQANHQVVEDLLTKEVEETHQEENLVGHSLVVVGTVKD